MSMLSAIRPYRSDRAKKKQPKFDKSKAHFSFHNRRPSIIKNHREILRLMNYYGLTVAKFADKCGIDVEVAEILRRTPYSSYHVVGKDMVVQEQEWGIGYWDVLKKIEVSFNHAVGEK